MDSALANKTQMPDHSRDINKLIEAANVAKEDVEFYQSTLDALIAQIAAHDKRYGTSYAESFAPRQPDNRKDPAPILIRLIEKHGPLDKKDLANRAWLEGGGRGKNKARQTGACGAAIEQMINAKPPTLVRRKDGKIGLP